VGDPHLRFEEDALRMLRALRFSARLDFSIEEETYAAIRDKAALLAKVSRERIQEEFNQILLSENPERIEETVTTGLMPYCLSPFDTKFDYASLARVPAERVLRWAMLLQTFTPEETEKALRGLKFDNDSRKRIVRLAAFRARTIPEEGEAMRFFLHELGREHFPDLYALRVGLEGNTPSLQRAFLQYQSQKDACLQINEMVIGGEDLKHLGAPDGPAMGRILEDLLEQVLHQPSLQNDREKLLSLAADRIAAASRTAAPIRTLNK
jgi:tRNA nucleotidyltransferase (CCA-adding enzyme)